MLLAGMMLVSGALLYLTLFPPHMPIGGETLVVLTAEAPAKVDLAPNERLVALPEAPDDPRAERVPDLATALRRHTQVNRIRIVGRGLTQRDRDFDAGLPAAFTPMPRPRGLVRLGPPVDTPAGSVFTVAGETNGLAGGTAELLDPAGRRVDRRVIGADGSFTMGGTTRAPGLATFTLRLRGADNKTLPDTPIPLRTIAQPPLRALLIGSPSPEVKYLRRWAEDSQLALQSRLEAGGGVNLGSDPVRLDSANLRNADVVIIDDTALAALGGGSRNALARAITEGLGVVIRMTAPATGSTRNSWRALGLSVEGGSEVLAVSLPPLATDSDMLASQRGLGSEDVPALINTADDPAPDLGRWDVQAGAAFVPAVVDADGGIVSGWQQRQQGRVALWTAANSYALVLNGQADRYYQWWSDTVSAVSRPDRTFRPRVSDLPRAGERMTICGIGPSARVTAPDGAKTALVIDPLAGAEGCAAYWPGGEGVHTITQDGQTGTQSFDMAVAARSAFAGVVAAQIGEATDRWAASQRTPSTRLPTDRRGAAWPYLAAWLLLAGIMWWSERRWLKPKPPGT